MNIRQARPVPYAARAKLVVLTASVAPHLGPTVRRHMRLLAASRPTPIDSS